MSCPNGHDSPRPDECKWCLMATTKDARYASVWWDSPVQAQSPPPKTESGSEASCGENTADPSRPVTLAVRRERPAARSAAGTAAIARAVQRKTACLHLLEPTGQTHRCPSCKGEVRVKEFGCARHGKCTVAKPVQGLAHCGGCPDYVPADRPTAEVELSKDMPLPVMLRLLEGPVRGWPKGWESWPVTMEAHRLLLERHIATLAPYPNGKFDSDGIVIGAGGANYFACAMVSVAILRHVGCTLPVEFWHLGPGEMDPKMRSLASEVGVECIDARAIAATLPPARRPRILNGWELKPFSIVHSRFQRVLYLDADNVAAADPAGLFADPDFQKTGAIFWPDLPPAYRKEWLPKRVFEVAGIQPSPDTAFESGQLLIDKRQCWAEINATMHINEHSDFWYGRTGGPDMIYGDKDTFWIAWHKTGRPYAQTATAAGWKYPAIFQHDLDGKLVFQHACQGKGPLGSGERIACLVHADATAAAGKALRSKWHGRPWEWADQSSEEMALAKEIPGIYHYRRIGHDERLIEIKPGGDVGVGSGGCEQRWSVRLLDGAPTLVISGQGKGMMFLRKDGEGVWCGRWEHHERMPIELAPVKA